MQVRVLFISVLCVIMLFISGMHIVYAQLSDKLFATDYRIDTLNKGKLSVEIDNMTFFKDNEYISTVQKGYTLPGFWLQAKAVYYPFTNLKVEGGAHSIWFWGTTRYPAFAYKSIAQWSGQDYAHNVHILPYLRAHLSLSDKVSVVLGDIYGGANHRLIEPLYNQELNLSADPEKGVQFLYDSKRFKLDLWLDWVTYIYRLDTHQEAFLSGASARFLITPPESRLHFYIPIQSLTQHKGGEIVATMENIQTIMNGALGAGVRWNINGSIIKFADAEFDMAGFVFPKGSTTAFERGRGYYTKASMQLKDFNLSTFYWSGNNFISIMGNAFYNSISSKIDGMLYRDPKMLYCGADYVRSLGKGFTFGINAEAYYYLSGRMYSSLTGEYQSSSFGSNTNFSIGIYLRINPSFLIKQY